MDKFKKIGKMLLIFAMIGILAMSCAANPYNIIGTPGSTTKYMSDYYNCEKLLWELGDAESKVSKLTVIQSKAHKNDKVVIGASAGVGWIFFPALLGFLGLSSVSGNDKEQELSIEKGKMETLNEVIRMKECW